MLKSPGWSRVAGPALSLVLVAYALGNVALTQGGISPDEEWFFRDAPTVESLHLAYGYWYWRYLAILHNFALLRLLAYGYLLGIVGAILLVGRMWKLPWERILFGVLVWLAMPIAWWRGKLIGPELPSAAVGIFGVYWACRTVALSRRPLGLLGAFALIGVAAGIKLNNAVFGVFSGVLLLADQAERWRNGEQSRHLWRDVALELSAMMIGFLVAFIPAFGVLTDGFTLPDLHVKYRVYETLFMNNSYTWDFMLRASLPGATVGFGGLLVLAAMVKKDRYALALCACCGLMLVAEVRQMFAWYFLPLGILIAVVAMRSCEVWRGWGAVGVLSLAMLSGGADICHQVYFQLARKDAQESYDNAHREFRRLVDAAVPRRARRKLITVGFDLSPETQSESEKTPYVRDWSPGAKRNKRWEAVLAGKDLRSTAVVTLSPMYYYAQRHQLDVEYGSGFFRDVLESGDFHIEPLGEVQSRKVFLITRMK